MNTATFWCLIIASLAAATAVAAGALAWVMARRVDTLAADLAGITSERPSCPDRGRITALEDYARGGPAGPPRGRHGRRPPPQPQPRPAVQGWPGTQDQQPRGRRGRPPAATSLVAPRDGQARPL